MFEPIYQQGYLRNQTQYDITQIYQCHEFSALAQIGFKDGSDKTEIGLAVIDTNTRYHVQGEYESQTTGQCYGLFAP